MRMCVNLAEALACLSFTHRVQSPVLTAHHLTTSWGIENANVRVDLTNIFRSAPITIACRRVAAMQSLA